MPYAPPSEREIQAGAYEICKAMRGGQPFFFGRNGTIEIEVLFFWFIHRRGKPDAARPYPAYMVEKIQRNAGVFPDTADSIDAWCEAYTESLQHMTGTAAGWYAPTYTTEGAILQHFAPADCPRMPLRSLEPYYVPASLKWTRYLAEKRVAVVSSFAETIRKQIWNDKIPLVWPQDEAGINAAVATAEWTFIPTGYAPSTAMGRAAWPEPIRTWQQAVDSVVTRVVDAGTEIALIGCGALGMIIAGRLRARGISAIVLGGAIQVLFGIKGGRWESHDVIGRFWNDAWVWPAATEVPGGANLVEDGCYWRKPA